MMDEPLNERLREAGWRRKLTEAEQAQMQAWLTSHPGQQAGWEADEELTRMLDKLPDAPVSSNFTARVMQSIELEQAIKARQAESGWLRRRWWARWVPRLAGAFVVLGLGLFSVQQVRVAHRATLAQSVATVSTVSSMPSPEILQDFDTIRVLNQTPAADETLLALLK